MTFTNETLEQMQEQAIRNAIEEYSYTAPPLPQNLSYSEMLLYNKAMEGRWRCIEEVARLAIPQFYKLLLDEADVTPKYPAKPKA